MTEHDSFVQTIPLLPRYIPQDVNMTAVKAQIAASGVSAPPDAMPGLLSIVNQAHAEGINLKIVLLDHNPPNDTPLRDISTVVGADYHDVTVLTLSPNFVGSYSTHFPRVTLEADLVAFVQARSLTLDFVPLYRRYAFLAVLQTGPRAIASLD